VPLLVVIAIVAAACSTSATGGAGSFRERLELLPASVIDDPGTVIVAMADLDRAAQLAGVERPADASDVDAVRAYVQAVTGIAGVDAPEPASVAALTPETAHVERLAQVDEFDDQLGWSIADVSWFAEVQVPPNTFMVAGGDVDEARLTEAMGERRDGIWRLGGEDGEVDFTSVSAARPLGESLRSALVDGRLIVGRSTPPVVDAVDGDGPTLADDDVLRSLAQAMDDPGAYSVLLTAGGSYGVDPRAALAGLEDQVLPQPFRGVAGGLASEDGVPVVLLAYVHDSAAAAEANADALGGLLEKGHTLLTGEPWSNLLTAGEIGTDGSMLVARLGLAEQGNPQIAYDLLVNRDALVTHG
jgi:hypothetical protein